MDPASVEVLTTLPELYIWRSGFRVVPVLAWWHSPGPVAAVGRHEERQRNASGCLSWPTRPAG